ncbi:MAG TPA: hypothetical protein VFZ48_05845 [Candidatus Saccharimonadales bacterium]
MSRVDAQLPGTSWTGISWHDASQKALLEFFFMEGAFVWLAFKFKNPRLPHLYLAPGGGVKYDDRPWDTGELPGEQYAALSAALLDECRSLLRRHNIRPSREARQLFDM